MKRITHIKPVLFLVALVSLVFNSCDTINPDEAIPAYIHIDDIAIIKNPELQGKEGSLNNKVTDAWVSANGKVIGAFELPATIPIIAEGDIEIFVAAGIKKNGQTGVREIYPFWTNYVTTIKAVPGKIDTLKPEVMYRSNSKFVWKENFETSSISLDSTAYSDMDSIGRTNDPNEVLEPTWSGVVEMPKTGLFEVQTKDQFVLPRLGTNVYLEVSFKGNVGVQFGMISLSPTEGKQIPIVIANPTEEWTKLYISLKEDLGPLSREALQRIFIGVYNLDETVKPKFYLDNLKLLYLE